MGECVHPLWEFNGCYHGLGSNRATLWGGVPSSLDVTYWVSHSIESWTCAHTTWFFHMLSCSLFTMEPSQYVGVGLWGGHGQLLGGHWRIQRPRYLISHMIILSFNDHIFNALMDFKDDPKHLEKDRYLTSMSLGMLGSKSSVVMKWVGANLPILWNHYSLPRWNMVRYQGTLSSEMGYHRPISEAWCKCQMWIEIPSRQCPQRIVW